MKLDELKYLNSRICALTAYDYPTARILDELNVDIILVGDSLGMMVFGHEDTTDVSMEMMIHHTSACRKGVSKNILITDMPYNSYECVDTALENAQRLMNAGADGVKLEGGNKIIDQIKILVKNDIPVIGHLGFLPQSIKEEKTYKKKGKIETEKTEIYNDSKLLESAGVSALVLESVEEKLARDITQALKIPTIGIGSGINCSGEIRVINDIIGSYPWFKPPFATSYCSVSDNITEAVKKFKRDIIENTNL